MKITKPIEKAFESMSVLPSGVVVFLVSCTALVASSVSYAYGGPNWAKQPVDLVQSITESGQFRPDYPTQQCVLGSCTTPYSIQELFWYPGAQCLLECGLLGNDLCYDLLQTTCLIHVCSNGTYWTQVGGNSFVGCTTPTGQSYTHPCPTGTCYP